MRSPYVLQTRGFTIVELIVVIVVLGVLAAVVVVLYDTLASRTYDSTIQSELRTVHDRIDLEHAKTGRYPDSLDTILQNTGIELTEGKEILYDIKPYGYCMVISHTEANSTYRVRSLDGEVVEGDCASEATVLAGSASGVGLADGMGTEARFNSGNGSGSGTSGNGGALAVTETGDVYVADHINDRIRHVTPEGQVTTIAGGNSGCVGGTGTAAGLGHVMGMVYDEPTKMLYFLGCSGSRLFSSTLDGEVTLLTSGFYWARGLVMGPDRHIYVMGTEQHRIYRVNTSTGVSEIFAGSSRGFADGPALSAQFDWPWSGVFDGEGNLYVRDAYNYRMRKITPSGTVSSIAGNGTSGITNGTGTSARFYHYAGHGLAIDSNGIMYVHESSVLRTVTTAGEVQTYRPTGQQAYFSVGNDIAFTYGYPLALTFGPEGVLYAMTARGVIKIIL